MRTTDRDMSLLQALAGYEILSTSQVRLLIFDGIRRTTMLRRLRALEANKLIKRHCGLPSGEHSWTLTTYGAHYLGLQDFHDNVNKNTLDHDITLNQLRIKLEQEGIATSWQTEQSLRRNVPKNSYRWQEPLIPDAIFAIPVGRAFQSLALELELSVKNPSRYDKIFERYGRMRKFWGLWYVVKSPAVGKRLAKIREKNCKYVDKPVFGWVTVNDILQSPDGFLVTTRTGQLKIRYQPQIPAHPTAHAMSAS